MFLIVQLLFALFLITLLFLSNFDQRVSYSLLGLYLFIFLYKWAKNKITFLFKMTLAVALASFVFSYLKNKNAPIHLENAISSIKQHHWKQAKDNFTKIYRFCHECREDLLSLANAFDQNKLQTSFSEKSEKLNMMMTVIKDKHQNIDTKDLPKVLIEKSKNELLDLKVRFQNAQNKSMILRKLANQKEDFSVQSTDFDQLNSTSSNKYDYEFFPHEEP